MKSFLLFSQISGVVCGWRGWAFVVSVVLGCVGCWLFLLGLRAGRFWHQAGLGRDVRGARAGASQVRLKFFGHCLRVAGDGAREIHREQVG